MCGQRICRAVTRSGFRHVEIQINCEKKLIRVKGAEKSEASFTLASPSGGGFSCSAELARMITGKDVMDRFIELSRDADGWWVGSFDNEHSEDDYSVSVKTKGEEA